MEYVQKETVPYFADYEQLVAGLGYKLVDLQVIHQKSLWLIKAVIYSKTGVGVEDCSKVHRALLSRAEVLLNSQDIQMEVSSPGLNRVIKNAAEFPAFVGETVKVLEASCSDWLEGELLFADSTHICLKTSDGQKDIRYADIKKAKLNKI
ncbi:MAG: ribosome maturation factor RimP [Treponema sp.]